MLFKCQHEPFLKQFNSTVLECKEVKKGKKKHYQIVLEDTILFAEGGGQPSDHGILKIAPADISNRESVQITDVQRESGKSVHTANKPLPIGAVVDMEIDWERRYDHMQQHTGQHLLSAIAEQEPYLYKTVSWNLGSTICFVELNTPSITDEIKSELEKKINSLIQKGLRVVTKVYDSKEDPALSSAHTRGLPADHSGPIRVIEITGVDENMCCGTHLTSLSQIQMIKLLHTENKRGNTLLYFVCGDRVSQTLQSCLDIQYQLNSLLSSPPDKFSLLVDKLQKDNRANRKQADKLSEELATLHAQQLLNSEDRVFHIHRPTVDQDYSLTLQRELRESCEKRLLLLTMGEKGAAQFVFRGPVEVVDKIGKQVAAKLGGKGGGKDGRLQGKFSDLSLIPETVAFLKDTSEL